MTAISKIRQAGFELNLLGDAFEITPASKLLKPQRDFLRSHKSEIISELRLEQMEQAVNTSNQINKPSVICYTPNGSPILVEYEDEQHAEFLMKMNPYISK